jgi:hypothetical protein
MRASRKRRASVCRNRSAWKVSGLEPPNRGETPNFAFQIAVVGDRLQLADKECRTLLDTLQPAKEDGKGHSMEPTVEG